MNFGFQTDLSVTKLAEAGFGLLAADRLFEKYPSARERIMSACREGRALWKFNEPLWFLSERVGLVVVPEGYITDFASVPRVPLAFWLAGDTAHASAGVHDLLCSEWIQAEKITWREAAEVFREAMVCEGVAAWRRWLMYNAVLGADPANKIDRGFP